MDTESRSEFKEIRHEMSEIKTELSDIKVAVKENTAYHKGLNVDVRLTKLEQDIPSKSSWGALYMMSGFVFGLAMLVLAVVKMKLN